MVRPGDQVLVKCIIKEIRETAEGIEYLVVPESKADNYCLSMTSPAKDVITCQYCCDSSNLNHICKDCAEKLYRVEV